MKTVLLASWLVATLALIAVNGTQADAPTCTVQKSLTHLTARFSGSGFPTGESRVARIRNATDRTELTNPDVIVKDGSFVFTLSKALVQALKLDVGDHVRVTIDGTSCDVTVTKQK